MERTFTTNWFNSSARPNLDTVIPALQPLRVLEIGSYEGASTCYFIDTLSNNYPLQLHCIDTWEGGVEHEGQDMKAVFERFHANIKDASDSVTHEPIVTLHRGRSDDQLLGLLQTVGKGYFDFIYVDGSHQAADVLNDAVLAFMLLRVGGVMAFDDYLWYENSFSGRNILNSPKIAVDAFVNINSAKLQVHNLPAYQLFVTKIAD